jgi:hypothetical protein
MTNTSKEQVDKMIIITEADRIEEKAQNLLMSKIGWMTHEAHPHSIAQRFWHKLFHHHDHHDHHHHGLSYLDKNPNFYKVSSIFFI